MRLDVLLAERGLFESRARAAASVLAGDVLLLPGRERASKPGQMVASDGRGRGRARRLTFVSRGGVKLANALGRRWRSTSPALWAWTWERRPADSPTACCSAEPRTSSRWTSPTGS